MEQENNNKSRYRLDSCNAILDTAKTIYSEEADRFKQVESKAGITIGFVGVIFGFFLTNLGPTSSKNLGYILYSNGFRLAAFFLLSLSLFKFISSIKVGVFAQVDIDKVVSYDLAEDLPEKVTLSIASTYEEVIQQNKEKIDAKINNYNKGLQYMSWGFLLFLIYSIVEGIIKYG